VALPVASTIAGAGELPRSQSTVGDQSLVAGSTPSHCSTYTSAVGVKPVAATVNGSGLPEASPGTANVEPTGWVIVDAHATPANPTRHMSALDANTMIRRLPERIRDRSFPRARKRSGVGRSALTLIDARRERLHQSELAVFPTRSLIVHPASVYASPRSTASELRRRSEIVRPAIASPPSKSTYPVARLGSEIDNRSTLGARATVTTAALEPGPPVPAFAFAFAVALDFDFDFDFGATVAGALDGFFTIVVVVRGALDAMVVDGAGAVVNDSARNV
jgi:hypothetical protein